MASDEAPFSKLLDTIVDNRGKTCPTAETGIPLIATNCVRNELLYPTYDTTRLVSPETYSTWFRGHPKPGDILFVNKATPGRVCLVPDPVDFCIAQDMVAVRANDKRVYPKYLFAALRSSLVQERVSQMHVGSLIPHFKKGDFDKLLIPTPALPVQHFIGDLYFDISAKIDVSRRANETTEAILRTLFRSWFIDFDPVRAKMAGHQPQGMDPETGALFPSAFEESALGSIPKGWSIGSIADISDNIREQVDPRELAGDRPYVGLEHLPRRRLTITEHGLSADVDSAKALFHAGDILFGKLRPYFHKVSFAPYDGVCSTDILVIRPRTEDWSTFALCLASSDRLIAHAVATSDGTKMPRTSWTDLARFQTALPPRPVAAAFERQCAALLASCARRVSESTTLATLRDTLLPKLLGGELRVADAERGNVTA